MTHTTTRRLVLDETAQDLLFRQAHTVDRFTDEPVPDDMVRAVHDLVRNGPTAFNQQPLRLVLLRSPQSRGRLARHLSRGNRDKTVRAPLTALLAVDNHFHRRLPEQFPQFPGAIDLFTGEQGVRERSAMFNGALQAAYFIIGIRAAGLAAGPMSGFDEDGVNGEFFPDGDLSTLLLVNIGRPAPDGARPRGPRLGYDEIRTTL
ncbi:malonic semialdehyde reductase [Streptomyces griseoviridis]|uniref:Malonic semialdehyde reductase n=2 Tax=Streptomyces TaxID=1883 RepID=A0A3S9ZC65_STRGD|nr:MULTISPECIES: malonic semialdehyde reductase [Streptomyces]AZS85285.1 malonic semialdehyde reductase [Streptomyces griseoviridis]MDH6702942.1 3-hydroxypropanoate dehydrogenase [Streptomyces sp. MAA16]MDT0477102.1 malonic semialdehyde reductase [Streptomyces sp. DSM 41014]QCN87862.1 malonic semialdehyde reductase [Streptomyces griseoviridis]